MSPFGNKTQLAQWTFGSSNSSQIPSPGCPPCCPVCGMSLERKSRTGVAGRPRHPVQQAQVQEDGDGWVDSRHLPTRTHKAPLKTKDVGSTELKNVKSRNGQRVSQS